MRSVVEIGASVPAFLAKLWKLVNDTETNHLITWSPGGKTFIIRNQAGFARELLPLYYKHNNMASFIRQLNMYGFHKITSVDTGGLRYEKDEIEFSHPCFMRNHSYLLEHIKRKIANPKAIIASETEGKLIFKPELMNKVLTDVKQMKGKQENMDAKFSVMKQENEALWREVALLRQKHIKQQQIVNNLIQFLMSLVNPGRTGSMSSNGVGAKRGFQLMINNAAHNSKIPNKKARIDHETSEEVHEDNAEDGPTIHELAHDDILHSDPSGVLSPSEFLTIEVPGSGRGFSATSPNPRTPNSQTPRYHVTMADGDDNDDRTRKPSSPSVASSSSTGVPSPISTTPPPAQTNQLPGTSQAKKNAQTSQNAKTNLLNYSVIPETNMKLPADIFEDTNITTEPEPSIYRPTQLCKDEMLSIDESILQNLANGSYNSNIKKEKSAKTKRPNFTHQIKVEQDDTDWSDMSLATLDNEYDANNIQSADDLDDHLDTMQSDLDSLRELLKTDSYAFDTNTLMGLFGQDDPLYGLSFNPYEEKSNKADSSNQLMSYTGSVMPDLSDFELASVEEMVDDIPSDLLEETVTLNTPNVTLNTPRVTTKSPFTPNVK